MIYVKLVWGDVYTAVAESAQLGSDSITRSVVSSVMF
jgi:hypothetical protein